MTTDSGSPIEAPAAAPSFPGGLGNFGNEYSNVPLFEPRSPELAPITEALMPLSPGQGIIQQPRTPGTMFEHMSIRSPDPQPPVIVTPSTGSQSYPSSSSHNYQQYRSSHVTNQEIYQTQNNGFPEDPLPEDILDFISGGGLNGLLSPDGSREGTVSADGVSKKKSSENGRKQSKIERDGSKSHRLESKMERDGATSERIDSKNERDQAKSERKESRNERKEMRRKLKEKREKDDITRDMNKLKL